MSRPGKVDDADFMRLFEDFGPTETARKLNVSPRAVYNRRSKIEGLIGRKLISPTSGGRTSNPERPEPIHHPHRIPLAVTDGVVLVGSDAHIWPGPLSPAFRAFIKFAKELRPAAVIMNGDAFDGASISRHPPIGWAQLPTVQQEIEACQDALHLLEKAVPRKTRTIWSLGNHDARFETRIATVAPELAKVAGTSLQDHFSAWEPCWSTWINPDQPDGVVVKHRFKGGLHAPQNNTLWAGKSFVTGHLHSAKVQPISDYNGTRYGVDTGCLADPYAAAFRDYTEDSPRNWRSGFAVLTFKAGKLLLPELVLTFGENSVQFRGEIIEV